LFINAHTRIEIFFRKVKLFRLIKHPCHNKLNNIRTRKVGKCHEFREQSTFSKDKVRCRYNSRNKILKAKNTAGKNIQTKNLSFEQ
jgi:hypothetical protein